MKAAFVKTRLCAFVGALVMLAGGTAPVRTIETDATHPANPQAANGTAAPKDFSLIPAGSAGSAPTVRPDSPATHTHHHDS